MGTDQPTNLDAAQAAANEAELVVAKRRELDDADFKWLMDDPRGRRHVWRLMEEAGVFLDFASGDAAEMARFLGQRRQGMKLLQQLLRVCPEQWLNMVKDQKRR